MEPTETRLLARTGLGMGGVGPQKGQKDVEPGGWRFPLEPPVHGGNRPNFVNDSALSKWNYCWKENIQSVFRKLAGIGNLRSQYVVIRPGEMPFLFSRFVDVFIGSMVSFRNYLNSIEL